jgi:hypothetical protein
MFRGEAEEDATLTGVAPPAQAVMPLVQPAECLKDKLDADERAIGDTGYRGEPTKVSITRPGDSAEVKKFKARVKSRHETFNARIKSFNVLNTAFRHAVTRHKECFESVCIAVQYDIENGHPLFEI